MGYQNLNFFHFFLDPIGDITAMRTRSWNKRRHYSTDTDSYKLSKHFINTSYISIQILVRVHQPENGCTKRELIWMSVPRFPFPRFTRLGSYTQNSLSSFYCWKNHKQIISDSKTNTSTSNQNPLKKKNISPSFALSVFQVKGYASGYLLSSLYQNPNNCN